MKIEPQIVSKTRRADVKRNERKPILLGFRFTSFAYNCFETNDARYVSFVRCRLRKAKLPEQNGSSRVEARGLREIPRCPGCVSITIFPQKGDDMHPVDILLNNANLSPGSSRSNVNTVNTAYERPRVRCPFVEASAKTR